MSSSPPDKQSTEVSGNPESSDTIGSDVQPEEVEDNLESVADSKSETSSTTNLEPTSAPTQPQVAKSTRLNPLTWWRNKTKTDSNQPSTDTPSVYKTLSIQESSSPSLKKSQSTSRIALPTSTTEIRLFGPLDTVGTENYLRYGLEGPRHYVVGIIDSVPTPDDITIQLEIVAADSTAKFRAEHIQLKRVAHNPQNRTVWGIHYSPLHAHIIWIWDFFRMLSSIQLSVEIPQSLTEDDNWTKLATTLQTLAPDDQLIIRVQNNVGSIIQIHRVKS